MLSYIFQYKFSLLLAVVIAVLSLMPDSSLPHSSLFAVRFFDKFVHISMYTAVGFSSLLESRCRTECSRFHLKLLLLLFFMGATIEVLQATVVATRSAEWLDLLANAMGLVAGYVAFLIVRRIRS
jgi:VanZ family protein